MIEGYADVSENVICVVVGHRDAVREVHRLLCSRVYGFRKCSLHFRKMTRARKKKLLSAIASTDFRGLKAYVIVVKGRVKRKGGAIMREISKILQSLGTSVFYLPSDFDKFVRRPEGMLKFGGAVKRSDSEDGVELADVLANYYRVTRDRRIFAGVIVL